MKIQLKRLALIGVSCGLVLLASARALQEGGAQEASAGMEAMMKYAAPGPMHEKLTPLVGQWKLTVKFRMAPDAPWTEMPSTATREWILDGRYLQETVKGEYMGAPFEGLGLIGYDNLREEYNYVWIDNASTNAMVGRGPSLTQVTGEVSDPMSGEKDKWFRASWKIEGQDRNVYESFEKGEDGKEFAHMQIVYERK